ncbi:RloB family protein [Enterococcus columbae]|uniref:Abortive phage resistance protein n=1 Tax=Enterococcus columbae DSM 7374 = ATCC 51263 TaxID=1121865 RepID=S0KI58_9ENTE|nr:RloB family protein [Enterococcus columbae]EOT44524.1 hypothetical protein OMW_00580 [Enterococcus columbae DSM 7374 = ATCC 51263]EOW84682.1 hypothetical protein I568_01178 [Enterococcus columbae DSM 7374 = ATCC 51263]OJG21092.1 hypothetical protein RR47_GL001475 [Enterococcus columbae DSM 7374 = ATCC 51263]
MPKKIGKRARAERQRLPEPKTYFIASEGTKTEVIYFRKFANMINEKYAGHEELITIPKFEIKGIGSSNFRLISDIEDIIRKEPRIYENVWIIFDMDDIPIDYFDNSISSAEAKGYRVGWSNDSFELWYLLHMEFLQSAIDRKQYTEKLRRYLKINGIDKYEKNDPRVFDLLYPKTKTAIKNAEKLEKKYNPNIPCSKKNPGTTVHKLVKELINLEDEIDKIKKRNKNM